MLLAKIAERLRCFCWLLLVTLWLQNGMGVGQAQELDDWSQRILPLPSQSLADAEQQRALLEKLGRLAGLKNQLEQAKKFAKDNPQLTESLRANLTPEQQQAMRQLLEGQDLPVPVPRDRSDEVNQPSADALQPPDREAANNPPSMDSYPKIDATVPDRARGPRTDGRPLGAANGQSGNPQDRRQLPGAPTGATTGVQNREELSRGGITPEEMTPENGLMNGGLPNPASSDLGGGSGGMTLSVDAETAQRLRRELNRRGLPSALREIVEEARRETNVRRQQEAQEGKPQEIKLPPNLADWAESIGKNEPLKTPSGENPSSNGNQSQSANQQDATASDSATTNDNAVAEDVTKTSWMSKLGQFAQRLYDQVSDAPGNDDEKAETGAPVANKTKRVAPDLLPLAYLLIGVCAVLLLGMGIVRWLQRGRRFAEEQLLETDEITTAAQLVRAFHRLVLGGKRRGEEVHEWWSHAQAARQLKQRFPDAEPLIGALVGFYERARYADVRGAMTEDELQTARGLLRKLTML